MTDTRASLLGNINDAGVLAPLVVQFDEVAVLSEKHGALACGEGQLIFVCLGEVF